MVREWVEGIGGRWRRKAIGDHGDERDEGARGSEAWVSGRGAGGSNVGRGLRLG